MSNRPENPNYTSNPHFKTEISNILDIENFELRKKAFQDFVEKVQNEYGQKDGKEFIFFSVLSLCMFYKKNNDNARFSKLKGILNIKKDSGEKKDSSEENSGKEKDSGKALLAYQTGEILDFFMIFLNSISNSQTLKNPNSKSKIFSTRNIVIIFLTSLGLLHFGEQKIFNDNFEHNQKIVQKLFENKIQPDGIKSVMNTVLVLCSDMQTFGKNDTYKHGISFCKKNFNPTGNTKQQIIDNWQNQGSLAKFSKKSNIQNFQKQCFELLKNEENKKDVGLMAVCDNLAKF